MKDICDNDSNSILSFNTIIDKCGNVCNWLEYQQLVEAIPIHWKNIMKSEELLEPHIRKTELLSKSNKTSKIVTATDEIVRKCVMLWHTKANINSDIPTFKRHFRRIYEITNVIKLRSFQYRLLHNKIFCNDVLVHWRKSESNICNLCNNTKQTIVHLLWECSEVKKLYENVFNTLIDKEEPIQIVLSFENILFNEITKPTNSVYNFIMLILKQYIYRCKCRDVKLSSHEAIAEVRFHYKLETRYKVYGDPTPKKYNKWRLVQKALNI